MTELGHRVDGGRPGDLDADVGPSSTMDRTELLRARQLVLEIGAHVVIERPVRLFSLLTQVATARTLWLQQQDAGRRPPMWKLERRLAGIQKIQRASS